MITNPGNPTGVALDEQEMRMIADVAKENDLFLISDEVYREFCYDDRYGIPTMGRFADIDENLVIIDSVSKRFSACGARVGCVITKNKELQQAVLKFCQSRLAVATIDQVCAAALYSVDESFYAESREKYRRRRDTVVNALREIPGVLASRTFQKNIRKSFRIIGRMNSTGHLLIDFHHVFYFPMIDNGSCFMEPCQFFSIFFFLLI